MLHIHYYNHVQCIDNVSTLSIFLPLLSSDVHFSLLILIAMLKYFWNLHEYVIDITLLRSFTSSSSFTLDMLYCYFISLYYIICVCVKYVCVLMLFTLLQLRARSGVRAVAQPSCTTGIWLYTETNISCVYCYSHFVK